MRDCIFLLADSNMQAAFTGFLTRDKFHLSLGIRKFDFDPKHDIIVHKERDPGVYKSAHQELDRYQNDYQYAVIVLDKEWKNSPGVKKTQEHINKNMISTGWDKNRFVVIVIDPELEAWILQDNPHVVEVLGFKQELSLKQWLNNKGLWDDLSSKCPDPKAAIEAIAKISKTPRSSAIYQKITSKISVKNCIDPAFTLLCETLRRWFPK